MTGGDDMTELVPAEAFSPGEILQEKIEERGWSQREFAEILGRPVAAVNEIIKGKRSITPATAKELAAALGTSPFLWLNLEAAYRLHTTEPPPRRIAIEARLRGLYPVKGMIQRGWIEHSKTPEVLEARVLEFFSINSLDETPELPHAAKKGGTIMGYDDSSPTQLAWLFRVKQIAEAMPVPTYTAGKLKDALNQLRPLMVAAEEIRHVPRILADAGVRFVIVEHLPGSKIDGVCFWLNKEQPVIGMSLRFDRIDNFWFVLRHEIEHALNRDASIDSELDKEDADLSDEEQMANEEAAHFCVPTERLNDFIARVDPLYSRNRILGFAKIVGVHPGLVVGQLQRRIKRYDLLRNYLVKVREVVTPVAMTDGHGRVCPV